MQKAVTLAVALMAFLSASGNRAVASASITGALNAIGEQAGTLSLVGMGFLDITKISYFQTNFGASVANPPSLTFDLGSTRIDIHMPANLNLASPFPNPRARGNFWLLIDSAEQSIMATPSAVITISTPVSSGSGGSYRHVISTGSYNNIGAGANVTFVDSGGSAISGGGGSNYYLVESGAAFTFGGGGGGNVLIAEPGATLIGSPGTFQTFERDDVTFSNFAVVPEPSAGLLLTGASLMFQLRRHRRNVAGVVPNIR